MLKVTIPGTELWDPVKEEFVYTKEVTLKLEYSLMAIAEWESKYHKSFINENTGTMDEFLDMVRCMTIDKNVDETVYYAIDNKTKEKIARYMQDPMTAATFKDRNQRRRGREKVTAETFYHNMVEYGIPFECQKWHINRLLALIRFCQAKDGPQKKRPMDEIANEYAALNKARRAKFKSKG